MALKVVTGRANAGKSGVVYPLLVDAAERGAQAVLLLPSHAEVVRARMEFAAKVPSGVTIATLDGWATDLWARFGDGRRVIDPVSRGFAAAQVSQSADISASRSFGYPSFPRLFADLCARCAGIAVAGSGRRLENELVRMLEQYRSLIEGWGLIELGECLISLGRHFPVADATIVANRFSSMSPQQLELLMGASSASDVLIALTYESNFPATEALEETVLKLRASGAQEFHVSVPDPTDELAHVEAHLYGQADLARSGAVVFGVAGGGEAEIALVVAEAQALLEEGVPPERIVVVFRDLRSRWRAIESALATARIEHEIDVSLPLSATPFGKAMRMVLSLYGGQHANREEVAAFLNGPYSCLAPEDAHDLDAKWRRSRETSARAIRRDIERRTGAEGKALLAAARASATAVADWGNWHILADTLTNLALRTRMSDAEIRLNAAAHRVVTEAVIRFSDARETPSLHDMSDSLGAMSVSAGASSSNEKVLVTEAHRIRGRRFDAVILGGLTAAEFSSEGQEPLVASLARRLGAHSGIDERLSERLLFYSIVTRARRRLVLVRQYEDSAGNPLRPSVFWEQMQSLFGEVEADCDMRLPAGALDRAAPTFSYGRQELREAAKKRDLHLPALAARGAERVDTSDIVEFSVTDLETYLRCPYQWFYDRVLSPRDIDVEFSAAEKGSLAHRLLADVYARLRGEGETRITERNQDRALTLLAEAEAEALSDVRSVPDGVAEQLSWNQAVRWCESILKRDRTFLPGFEPVSEEWRFGAAVDRPFTLSGVPIRGIVDRIDQSAESVVVTDYKSSSDVPGNGRFDAGGHLQIPVYAQVVAHFFDSKMGGGLYRSLSSGGARGFWRDELIESGSELSTRDQVSEENLEEIVKLTNDKVVFAAEGIRSGEISPRPSKDACGWCGARNICERRR